MHCGTSAAPADMLTYGGGAEAICADREGCQRRTLLQLGAQLGDARPAAEQLAEAAQLADPAAREAEAARIVRGELLMRPDDLACERLRSDVKRSKIMPLSMFDAVARQAVADAAVIRAEAASAEAAVPSPGHEIRMSSGDWEYATGDAEFLRGVYKWDGEAWRMLAELPFIHAQVIDRDGAGRRVGTSGLLSASPDGPRLVLDSRKIKDGSWAAELGVTLSADRKVTDAAATAIDDLLHAPGTPRREAVPTPPVAGHVIIPVPESLPGGYLKPSPLPRDLALARWADAARLVGEQDAAAMVLGGSAASWIIRLLQLDSYWLEMWGEFGQGKTTILRAAGAVWGDPSKGGGVVMNWDASGIGLGRHLGALGMLPAFFDEVGVSKFGPAEWSRTIFATVEGNQRLTGERGPTGQRVSQTWGGIVHISGNARVTAGLAKGAFGGLARRIISAPSPFTSSEQQAEQIAELITECFGHLGAELLARYTVADARQFMARATGMLPPPEGPRLGRLLAKLLRVAVAGALMCDEVLGLGDYLAPAVVRWALGYLTEQGEGPGHDADLVLDAIREAMSRESWRWPTVSEYREQEAERTQYSSPGGELPRRGVAHELAGIQADDGSWVAVYPTPWEAEICAASGADSGAALAELYRRDVLQVSDSRRKRSKWVTEVRVMSKPAVPVEMYKLALPPALPDDADPADDADTKNFSRTHATCDGDSRPTRPTPQVSATISRPTPTAYPGPTPRPTPENRPADSLAAGRPADGAMPWLTEACVYLADCRTKGLDPKYHPTAAGAVKVIGHRADPAEAAAIRAAFALALDLPAEYIEGIAAEQAAEAEQAAAPQPAPGLWDDPAASGPEQPAEQPAPAVQITTPPAAPQRPQDGRRPAWLVLTASGRAHGPDGAAVTLPPGALQAIRHAGDLAALALELGTGTLWVPREVRELLALPAALPALETRAGHPHPFTESADPAAWDIWPAAPVGLAGWLTVYRTPRSGDGAALAFPEWLGTLGDGPQFGDLAPAELADALTLIWRATTYQGKGGTLGGAHFTRSPQTTMTRLLRAAGRRRRSGPLEAATMPPPYHRKQGGALARVPSIHVGPPAEVPAGYLLAELDVQSCYLAAAIGTDFGTGEWERLTRPLTAAEARLPGVHMVRAQAATAAIHPALWPILPPPRSTRQAETSAYVDTVAARWLADCKVPHLVAESYVWHGETGPDGRGFRVLDSVLTRLGEARSELQARPGPAAAVAAAVVKAMYSRILGGGLAATYGGQRDPDDPLARPDWWLTVKMQAEVRKQRNLMPGLLAGGPVVLLGQSNVDSVYAAAPSRADLEAMPGTGGRPAIMPGQRGKFAVKRDAAVSSGLAADLGSAALSGRQRLAAIKAALGAEADDDA